MAEHPFDQATAVRAIGDGRFEIEIADRRWWVVRGPNGGFVGAILMRALEAAVDDPGRPPRSFTVHYPSAPQLGLLEIEVRLERAGRTTTYLSARAAQEGRLVALALAAFSAPFPGEDFSAAPMPDLPRPEEVEPRVVSGAPPFTENFEYRFAIGSAPFSGADEALSGGWLRLREPRVLDHALAATYTDAWPPAIFTRLDAFAVVPTIDLTIHFREPLPFEGARADDFAAARFRTTHSRDGVFEEDGEVWSADGRLLVQSRQLAAFIPL